MTQLYTQPTQVSSSIPTMADVTFREWFERQLRRRDWNQSDAARRMGIQPSVVSHWLSGKRMPSPQSCDLIADAFFVPVDLVLELAGHRPPAAPFDPTSPVPMLAALLEHVAWNPDRVASVENILRGFIERDRKGGA